MEKRTGAKPSTGLTDEPLWYKDAIFYELRVRSFYDSNGDGIGDFPGLTAKLDYLQELGVTSLWLLPFYPSPLRDDGYDISDYVDVHPDYGTLHDFKVFLKEAHRRGLRVITELVLNHTSDQHPWFQRARNALPGSPFRDFYVWSDTPDKYKDVRIIFPDFETSNWSWDPVAKAYYWHRFYTHQPDLNFDSPAVRKALFHAVDFWLGLGVDGLRLDAVPYLYAREGTNCENLPETHAFLRELRAHIDRHYSNRMLLAEANQWPEDAVSYFGNGKECHMAFHFPVMPRMFMAVRMEDRFPLVDIWAQTPALEEGCQWALFLRNHDELTLEMVTDEERDYMYRAYANEARMRINMGIRRRLAPLLGNNRRTIELNNGLLLSLPGTPVIYYGDEIGMGDNVYLGDRDGVRTPMQWSPDRNAGFSRANPQQLILPVVIDHEYHYQTVNVEAQERNHHSLLWWMKRIIALRKQFKAFGRGRIEFLQPENPRVLAFVRSWEAERILVVANLSRFVQYVRLDLSAQRGLVPLELFGRTEFPVIEDSPYAFSLGPHGFYWFSLQAPRVEGELTQAVHVPARIELRGGWQSLLDGPGRERLERALPAWLPHCRWFGAKARAIKATRVADVLALPGTAARLTLVDVEFTDGEQTTCVLPLGYAEGEAAATLRAKAPERIIAEVRADARQGASEPREGVIYDAATDPEFDRALLELVDRRRPQHGERGELIASTTTAWKALRGTGSCGPRALRVEQSHTSIVYGERLILKLFRRLEAGLSPDLEIGRYFSERAAFPHTPSLAGWLEWRPHGDRRQEPRTLALLHGFVPNHGDAWAFTRGELDRYYESAVTRRGEEVPQTKRALAWLVGDEHPDPLAAELVGAYLDAARLLGERTAEMHLALSASPADPAFAPQPYTALHHRSTYQSMRNHASNTLRLLQSQLALLPNEVRPAAAALLAQREGVFERYDHFLRVLPEGARIRCHGDLHLGQILHTGKDFVVIDFEGEPARPLGERRRKRSALRDVAGMLRSFHYAAWSALYELTERGSLGQIDAMELAPFALLWHTWVSWAFLRAYLRRAEGSVFLPRDREALHVQLGAYQLEKAIYELGYELNHRPRWVRIPLLGIEHLLRVTGQIEARPEPME